MAEQLWERHWWPVLLSQELGEFEVDVLVGVVDARQGGLTLRSEVAYLLEHPFLHEVLGALMEEHLRLEVALEGGSHGRNDVQDPDLIAH